MALHRNIYWVGRQWAVTGHGIQACDQKQKGQFDIEAAKLWEDGVQERVRALKWLNAEDFDKAISVARKYYPEPPRETRRPDVPQPKRELPATESPTPAVRPLEIQLQGPGARFLPVWRIRRRADTRERH